MEQRMAQLTSRWYRDERDLERMLKLVTASALRDGPAFGHLHRGDVVWGLFPNPAIDPAARIRLFEDGRGALRGFAWVQPPRHVLLQIATAMPIIPDLVGTMLRWAEEHLGPGDPVTTDASSVDSRLGCRLAAAGYRRDGTAKYRLNAQALAGEIPAPARPNGATVRPVRLHDPAELEARVALHREVWEPSKFTAEGYARLRGMPVYRPDLDLVAVTPAGELAAYCIVWWDPETRVAEFEPVGTSSRFRRQGYGTALLLDALGRLRGMGTDHAIVVSATDPESAPARRLYESIGFSHVTSFEQWERVPGKNDQVS
jgi:mycothiol synthase